MKRILFFLAIVLVAVSVSACTAKNQPLSEEKNAPLNTSADEDYNLADDQEVAAPATATPELSQDKPVTSSEPLINKNTIMNPDNQADLLKQYSQALIKTNYGEIKVKFYGSDSPVTVNNFLNLAKAGFYNGTKFHRVIKDFMIQGGDPLSKGTDTSVYGTGGPGYQFKDEFNSHKLVAGSLAMANSGPGTNGSQFFIVTAASTPWLDGHHTNFGEVISGLDIVKKIEAVETGSADRPIKDVIIQSVDLLK